MHKVVNILRISLGGRLTSHFQERRSYFRSNLHKYKSDQAQQRCPISQRTAPTNRLLGIPKNMGRDMDVGRYRQQPTIQAQPFMACGRYGVKLTHMGHWQFVRQEKGSRFMWSRMDHILQQNRATFDWHILGEITINELIPCRNTWPMCPTPIRQSAFRVL